MDPVDMALLGFGIFGFVGGSIILLIILPRVKKANAKQTP